MEKIKKSREKKYRRNKKIKKINQVLLTFALCIVTMLNVFAQQGITVTGTITDNTGESVPGVNIFVKGTTTGTSSNQDGNYSLTVPGTDAVLVFSYIGYVTEERPVGNQREINVILREDARQIEEVVVVGYGTQKKVSVMGAISTIQTEKMENIPVAQVSNALMGRLSGVFVNQFTGAPGTGASIRIRSVNTWKSGGSSPLYVIDGVILDKRSFDMLDYTEIETITVLKDAASAAVYGARAANGVILVSTKTGKEGRFRLNYNYSYSIDKPSKMPEFGTSADMVRLNNHAYAVGGQLPKFGEEEIAYFNNNDPGKGWFDEVVNDPTLQKHAINASGGTDKIKYFIGGNFFEQTAFIKNADYQKFNVRSNVEVKFTDELSGSFKVAYNEGVRTRFSFQEDLSGLDINQSFGSLWLRLLYYLNNAPPKTSDGRYVNPGWIGNPVAFIESGGTNRRKDSNVDANFGLTYKLPFLKGLAASVNYSRNYSNANRKHYEIKPTLYNVVRRGEHSLIYTDEVIDAVQSSYPNKERLVMSSETSNDYQLNFSLNYSNTFGDNNVEGFLGYEKSEGVYSYFEGTRENFPLIQKDQFWATSSDRADSYVGGNEREYGRASWIGRFAWNYAEKYFMTVAGRYDGSMRFAPDYRWGLFPSVQAGWIVSNEDFFNKGIFDLLKLRASFGLVGNDDVGGWAWAETYSSVGNYMFNSLEPLVRYGGIVNKKLTWEKTRELNVGFDSRFSNGFFLNMEYYNRHNYDILDSRIQSLPVSFGGSMPPENYGIVDAHGFEFELGYRSRVNEFNYGITGNFAYSKNKVILRDVAENVRDADNPNGRSTDYIRMLVSTGIIRTQADLDKLPADYTIYGRQPALGVINFEDVSGINGVPDGKIDDYDIQVIKGKHTDAPYMFGLNLTGDWKGLGFDILLQGFLGVSKIYNDGPQGRHFFIDQRAPKFWNDSWTPENPNAKYPQVVTWDYSNDHRASTFWLENSNYLRLQQVSLRYSLPKNLISKIKLADVTILLQGSNLLTLSGFKYYDPAVSVMSDYPTMRTISMGVNISF